MRAAHDMITSVPPAEGTAVCIQAGQLWWRGAAKPDRSLGTLLPFWQLLAADAAEKAATEAADGRTTPVGSRPGQHKTARMNKASVQSSRQHRWLRDLCASMSVEDAPLDGAPPRAAQNSVVLSSHRTAGSPSPPSNVFFWPEFDYEGRIGGFQAPLPLLQSAVWRRPTAWATRTAAVYACAALQVNIRRKRVTFCNKRAFITRNAHQIAKEFAERFHVQDLSWNFMK